MDVKPIHIAVAEDNPSDVATLREVLDQVGLDYALTVAVDGEEARDFILKRGRYQGCPPAEELSHQASGSRAAVAVLPISLSPAGGGRETQTSLVESR
jgi:hypothetical protein